MAKAIMDPEQVRRFAHDLQRFTAELQAQTTSLHGRFRTLGDSWQDQEHERFAGEFEQALRALAKFAGSANKHGTYLLRKAARIEEYLNQR